MGKGGARQGAGRKTKVEELKIVNASVDAITLKYGGITEGMTALLNTGEPSLIKFVFEHAVGKATDKMEVSEVGDIKTLKVIVASSRKGDSN